MKDFGKKWQTGFYTATISKREIKDGEDVCLLDFGIWNKKKFTCWMQPQVCKIIATAPAASSATTVAALFRGRDRRRAGGPTEGVPPAGFLDDQNVSLARAFAAPRTAMPRVGTRSPPSRSASPPTRA